MRKEKKLEHIMKWERRRGKSEFIRFLRGERITRQEAIAAKCYECEMAWSDGVKPCSVPDCPLNLYHPYYGEGSASKDNNS